MIEISGGILLTGFTNGVVLACVYILIALGLTLIISIMNILQFAHGEIYMLGAYVVYYITTALGLNAFLSIFISMIVIGILGLFLQRVVFRPLQGRFLPVMCVAIGMMLVMQTGVTVGAGTDPKHTPTMWTGVMNLSVITISNDRIAAVIAGLGLTVLLFLFLKRTRIGQAMTAVAQNREGGLLMGINPNLMYAVAMAIGSGLAAVAGDLPGALFILSPSMGGLALIKGVAIIVIGGMGSLKGVLIGALIIGMCDGILALIFNSAVGAIVPLFIVVIILIIRPQGLFGHE